MLTVVIPTENHGRALVATLAALVEGATAGVIRDVVVADAGSSDDTASVADIAGCKLLTSAAPLAVRLRQAAKAGRGSWYLFVRPGAVLDPGWTDEVPRFVQHCEQAGEAARRAALFAEANPLPATSLLAEAALLARRALRIQLPAALALVISRGLYDSIEGHSEKAKHPDRDLIARIGRSRLFVLRSRAVLVRRENATEA